MNRILALQQPAANEADAPFAPCFSIYASTITVDAF